MKTRITRAFSLSMGMLALAPACGADLDLTSGQGAAGSGGGGQFDCGAEPPEELEACDLEAKVCGWSGPDEGNPGLTFYRECACREAGENDLRWHCYQNVGGVGSCPATRPEHGSSCFGSFGSLCHYPERSECRCEAGGSEQWECTEPAPLPEHLLPPVDPRPDVPIVELGEEGRSAWCRSAVRQCRA